MSALGVCDDVYHAMGRNLEVWWQEISGIMFDACVRHRNTRLGYRSPNSAPTQNSVLHAFTGRNCRSRTTIVLALKRSHAQGEGAYGAGGSVGIWVPI